MRHFIPLVFILLLGLGCKKKTDKTNPTIEFAIVIHGGAGYITPENIDSTRAKAYRDTLSLALETAYQILDKGGRSVDAIEACIAILEDCYLFNAGRGSVYNSVGQQEMDASIMNGEDLNSGAVTGVRTIKHPIRAARLVMDSSKHVMFAGAGAQIFALEQGLQIVDSTYFYEPKGYDRIQKLIKETKHGTVGAVAIDKDGNIAAATSTGGMFNKKWNRIGDSPIIGAGTYANNESCGISCTGTGEFFIRTVAAHAVADRVKLLGESLEEAMIHVLDAEIKPLGGEGGMIGIDKDGNIAYHFNTPGMFRAYRKAGEPNHIELFGLDK